VVSRQGINWHKAIRLATVPSVLPLAARRLSAGVIVAALGLALVSALMPYASGLLGAPMLYVIWHPVQERLTRRLPARLSAGIIIALTILVIVLPGSWLITQLVGQAQGAVQSAMGSPLLARLREFEIGQVSIGPYLASAGQNVMNWIGGSAFSLIGAATRVVLNLTFAFFGLYFLLVNPGRAWSGIEPYIPFTAASSQALRQRFTDVTISTVLGTGLIGVVQGTIMGLAFAVLGIQNALFWGAVTAVLSILPLVGSGMVWIPAAAGLFLMGHPVKAVGLTLWGVIVVGNVDNLLRPWIYNRFAEIHPMITLVGAIVGVERMGFIGLILGPLAISYFFELVRMYTEEYVVVPISVRPPIMSGPGYPAPPSAAVEDS
jgi:predicted PurR-regulated permease PerM